MHLLHQQSDEILFSHFVTALNATFESKLALQDEGYESNSENFNIPTPLRRTSKIHHVSSVENTSLIQIQLHYTAQVPESHCRPVHRCLTFSSSEEDDDTPADEIPSPDSTPPVQYYLDAFQQPSSIYTLNAYITLEKEEEEEDFPKVLLNDEHH